MSEALAVVVAALIPAAGAALGYLLKSAREAGRAAAYRERSEATIAEKNLQLTQQREECRQQLAERDATISDLRAWRDRETDRRS